VWVKKVIRSIGYALEGIGFTIRTQRNMRIHIFVATPTMLLSWYLDMPAMELLFIWLCIGMVFSAELMNTALERLVDLVSPEYHPLAKLAKDAAAGAVLTIAIFCAIAVLFLLLPRLYTWALSWIH
jgi:diacylglycerol kinase